jgi:hypothetical protein
MKEQKCRKSPERWKNSEVFLLKTKKVQNLMTESEKNPA